MNDDLSRIDLVFCVDLTGSMSAFIAMARAHMMRILDAMREELGDGLRVAIVGLDARTFTDVLSADDRVWYRVVAVGDGVDGGASDVREAHAITHELEDRVHESDFAPRRARGALQGFDRLADGRVRGNAAEIDELERADPKRFADVRAEMLRGVEAYTHEVRTRAFPAPEHDYGIAPEELERLREQLPPHRTAV